MTDQATILITSVAEQADAQRLASALIENKYAACVSLLPQATSYYRWEGAVQCESEILLLIKTREDCLELIKKLLEGEHPYDTPELIEVKGQLRLEAYANWFNAQLVNP